MSFHDSHNAAKAKSAPWAVYAPTNLPGGLYKSTDGGDTWHQLSNGLPADDFVGKIGVAVAPSNPNRVYAVLDDLGTAIAPSFRASGEQEPNAPKASGGIYLSDDAGATWRLVNGERRLWGAGGTLARLQSIPQTPTAPTT